LLRPEVIRVGTGTERGKTPETGVTLTVVIDAKGETAGIAGGTGTVLAMTEIGIGIRIEMVGETGTESATETIEIATASDIVMNVLGTATEKRTTTGTEIEKARVDDNHI